MRTHKELIELARRFLYNPDSSIRNELKKAADELDSASYDLSGVDTLEKFAACAAIESASAAHPYAEYSVHAHSDNADLLR